MRRSTWRLEFGVKQMYTSPLATVCTECLGGMRYLFVLCLMTSGPEHKCKVYGRKRTVCASPVSICMCSQKDLCWLRKSESDLLLIYSQRCESLQRCQSRFGVKY